MTDDSDTPDVGVLRPVSVLTDPRVTDEPPTVTDGLRCLRDVRVLGPTPAVGGVSFAGRLGRRVAARRDRVALTLVRRQLGVAGERRDEDGPTLPDWNPQRFRADTTVASATREGSPAHGEPPSPDHGTPPTDREVDASDRGTTPPDRGHGPEQTNVDPRGRPSRVFAVPRRDGVDPARATTASRPGAGTGTGSADERRTVADWSSIPSTSDAADSPDTRRRDGATDRVGRRADREGPADRTERRDRDATDRSSAEQSGTDRGPGRRRVDERSGDATAEQPLSGGDERPSGAQSDAHSPRDPDRSVTASPVRRQSRESVARATGGAAADAFTRRLDRLAGAGADPVRRSTPGRAGRSSVDAGVGDAEAAGRSRAGEETFSAGTATSPSTRAAGQRSGSGDRVAALHDVSVLHGTTPPGARGTDPSRESERSVGTAPPSPSGATASVAGDRPGHWTPTFRRRPSPGPATPADASSGDTPASTRDPPFEGRPTATDRSGNRPTTADAPDGERPATADRPSPSGTRSSPGTTPSGRPTSDRETPTSEGVASSRGEVVDRSNDAVLPATPASSVRPDVRPRPHDRSGWPSRAAESSVDRRVDWRPGRDRATTADRRRAVGDRATTVDRRLGAGDHAAGRPSPTTGPPGTVRESPTRRVVAPPDAAPVPGDGTPGPDEPSGGTKRRRHPSGVGRPADRPTAARRGTVPDRTGADRTGADRTTAIERAVTDRSFVRPDRSPQSTGTAGPPHARTVVRRPPVSDATRSPGPAEADSSESSTAPERDRLSTGETGNGRPTAPARRAAWRPRRRVRDATPRTGDHPPGQPPERTVRRRREPAPGVVETHHAAPAVGHSTTDRFAEPSTGTPGDTDRRRDRPEPARGRTREGPSERPVSTAPGEFPSSTDPSGSWASTAPGGSPAPSAPDLTPARTPPLHGTRAGSGVGDVSPETTGWVPSRETTPDWPTGPDETASRDREGASPVNRPADRTGPVWHAPSRPGGASAPAPADLGDRTSRDPRVTGGRVTGGHPADETARPTVRRSPSRPGRDAGTSARQRRGATRSATGRRPLTHRLPLGDGPSEGQRSQHPTSGARSPSGRRPQARRGRSSPTNQRSDADVASGDRPSAGTPAASTPGAAWLHETRTGSGPGTGRSGTPGRDSSAARSDASTPGRTGSGSGPPVHRSGRESQVGTSRIGALTEMPTLTHQVDRASGPATDTAGGPQSTGPRAGAGSSGAAPGSGQNGGGTPDSPAGQRRPEPGGQSTRPSRSDEGGEPVGRRQRSDARRWNTASLAAASRGGSGARDATGPSPGHGRESDTPVPGLDDLGEGRFPDLHVKQPAPRVDATHREARSGPRYEQRPGESERRADESRGTDPVERAVEDAFFGQGSDLSAYDAEVDRVVDRLYREVERKMRIERERRGL